jgi:hypothetical protein
MERSLFINRRKLVGRCVVKRLYQVFSAAAQAWVQDVDLHPGAHIPSHAAGIGIAARTLDRDHQPVWFELPTEPD